MRKPALAGPGGLARWHCEKQWLPNPRSWSSGFTGPLDQTFPGEPHPRLGGVQVPLHQSGHYLRLAGIHIGLGQIAVAIQRAHAVATAASRSTSAFKSSPRQCAGHRAGGSLSDEVLGPNRRHQVADARHEDGLLHAHVGRQQSPINPNRRGPEDRVLEARYAASLSYMARSCRGVKATRSSLRPFGSSGRGQPGPLFKTQDSNRVRNHRIAGRQLPGEQQVLRRLLHTAAER